MTTDDRLNQELDEAGRVLRLQITDRPSPLSWIETEANRRRSRRVRARTIGMAAAVATGVGLLLTLERPHGPAVSSLEATGGGATTLSEDGPSASGQISPPPALADSRLDRCFPTETDTEAPEFIGLTESEAHDLAVSRGYRFRVLFVDGICEPIRLMDFDGQRVNVALSGGGVVRAALF